MCGVYFEGEPSQRMCDFRDLGDGELSACRRLSVQNNRKHLNGRNGPGFGAYHGIEKRNLLQLICENKSLGGS